MSILKNKAVRFVAILLLVAALIPLVLEGGTLYAERTFKPWRADYEKQELMPTLKKDTLTEADYELIYKQTGLTRVGTDALLTAIFSLVLSFIFLSLSFLDCNRIVSAFGLVYSL